jgi:hypothetical protein
VDSEAVVAAIRDAREALVDAATRVDAVEARLANLERAVSRLAAYVDLRAAEVLGIEPARFGPCDEE